MARSKPMLTEAQVADIVKMRSRECSIKEIADAYGVNHVTIRRALRPGYLTKPGPEHKKYVFRPFAKEPSEKRQPKFRVTDYLDHPMERLIHEGPTPEQRALMQEVRA